MQNEDGYEHYKIKDELLEYCFTRQIEYRNVSSVGK